MSEVTAEQLPVRPWGWGDVLALAALVLISGALVGSSLLRRDLWNPDETRFSVIARCMPETGYLVPHQGAAVYQDKPPLVFWLMNLSAAVTGGFSDAAMKLPGAAASVLLAVAFYLMARLFFGRLASLLAVLVLQTNILFLVTAQFAMTDLPLMCLQAWATYCFLRGEYAPGRARGWYAAFYVLCALATLTKGPVGLLVPGAVLAVWVVASGRFRHPRRLGLHWGLPLYAAVVAAWLLPATIQAGRPYLEHLLGNLTVWRVSGSQYHRHQPWFYYLWTFFPCFWPWSFYAPEALVRSFLHWWRDKEETPARRRAGEGLLLVLLWFVVVMVGWSVAGVKRVRYVMFAYLAVSLAVGWLWAGLLTKRDRWSWATTGATVLVLVVVFALVGAALVGAVPGLGEWALGKIPLDSSVPTEQLKAGLAGWHRDSLLAAVTVAAVGIGLLWSFVGRRRWVWLWVALVPVALQVNATVWVFPLLDHYRSMRPTADICQRLRAQHPQATIILYALPATGTSWYANDTTLLAARTPKEVLALLGRGQETFVLTEASHLDELVAADPRFGEFPRQQEEAGVRRILVLRTESGEGASGRR